MDKGRGEARQPFAREDGPEEDIRQVHPARVVGIVEEEAVAFGDSAPKSSISRCITRGKDPSWIGFVSPCAIRQPCASQTAVE